MMQQDDRSKHMLMSGVYVVHTAAIRGVCLKRNASYVAAVSYSPIAVWPVVACLLLMFEDAVVDFVEVSHQPLHPQDNARTSADGQVFPHMQACNSGSADENRHKVHSHRIT
jgi:hypothetical protein